MSISSRHEGDLGGQFKTFTESTKRIVTLVLDGGAQYVAVQHCAWMLANMLVRFEGYLERVVIYSTARVISHDHVFPFPVATSNFSEALVRAAASFQLLPIEEGPPTDLILYVGPGRKMVDGLRVYGDGWCGGMSERDITLQPRSNLPFGPYIAACFAASEVFKTARLKPDAYERTEGFFNAWTLQTGSAFLPGGADEIGRHSLACILAGVGAVGSAFLHTMAACPTLDLAATLADNDEKGIELSNLNRYVLFGRESLGRLKPDRACELLNGRHMTLTSWNDEVAKLGDIGGRVLSAVDKNISRASIQNRYPARIIGASTDQLRCEVIRCGPPAVGACLGCYNPPEKILQDEKLIERLKAADEAEFVHICLGAGVAEAEARSWIETKKCGSAGSALLKYMRQNDPSDNAGTFSVGFTSVLSGVLLATEFVKDSLGAGQPLDGTKNRVNFQFWNVTSDANQAGFLARDPNCHICSPGTPAASIWSKRFYALK